MLGTASKRVEVRWTWPLSSWPEEHQSRAAHNLHTEEVIKGPPWCWHSRKDVAHPVAELQRVDPTDIETIDARRCATSMGGQMKPGGARRLQGSMTNAGEQAAARGRSLHPEWLDGMLDSPLPSRECSCVSLRKMVHPTGFEPVAPRLGILCSILLSYGCPFPPVRAAAHREQSG
jgi:hypothetical protein